MSALDDIEPSTLDREEVQVVQDVVAELPKDIISDDPVDARREKQRQQRDRVEEMNTPQDIEARGDEQPKIKGNDIYKIMKNNEILGQILRNKYGNMKRERISEIIETVGDGGLRIIKLFLAEGSLNDYVSYIHGKHPELDEAGIRKAMKTISFLITIAIVDKVVWELNKPEIRPLVEDVVAKQNTPAYELFSYFLRLDTAKQLDVKDKEKLKELWNKHRYDFFHSLISLRTQVYLSTHRVKAPIEQAICSILNIKYRAKMKEMV